MHRRKFIGKALATVLGASAAVAINEIAEASTEYLGRFCQQGTCGACSGSCYRWYDLYRRCNITCTTYRVYITTTRCGTCKYTA